MFWLWNFPRTWKRYLTKLANSNFFFKQTLAQKFSRIKLYIALAIPILVYVSEIWTLRKKRIKILLTWFAIKVFRWIDRSILSDRRNEEILKELKAEPVDEKLSMYKSKWLRNVTRMNNRMPKIMLNCRPNRRRRLRRPLKRLLNEAERGLSRPISW
jgi:hypothetical protein